jgi:hypothetical protein
MRFEPWARFVVERELGQTVFLHDDQSQPGMYDLRVGSSSAPLIAIECVGAIDATFSAFWNAGPARGSLQTSLTGDWIVVLHPKARVKALRAVVENVLQPWDGVGEINIYVDWQLERAQPVQYHNLRKLGVSSLHCVRKQGNGKVFLNPENNGGMVDEHGTVISSWIGEFLRATERADVIRKLARAGCSECHVFVPVGWSGARWDVESYLTSGLEHLPDGAPDLPAPITSAWIVSLSASLGIRWDGARWLRFDAGKDDTD